MNPKKVVKQLVQFTRREYSQKKPLKVSVLRRKKERILTKGGPIKVLSISRTLGALYLVMAEYSEGVRIYYYSREGKPLGTRNFDMDPILLENVKKSTIKEFEIPK